MNAMGKVTACWIGLVLIPAGPATARQDAKGGAFAGEWKTSIGVVTVRQDGDKVRGAYGPGGKFTIEGVVKDKALTFSFQEGNAKGDARWTLDDSGISFHGGFQLQGGRQGSWDGWRPDPKAVDTKASAQFAGSWLTDLGLMQLTQEGDEIKGKYAQRGTSEIEGDVKGRRLEFRFKAFRNGAGWFDLAADGKSLAGAAHVDGFDRWFGWKGRSAPEYQPLVKPAAGRFVDGATSNLLTYVVRAPEGYKEGDKKTWPAIVILHGSNMNGRDYAGTFPGAWPDIARDYFLIGLNGETPSNTGEPPQFNFSYVNYVGRSTFGGFPGTDRESPALVAEALTELKKTYPIKHYFVGGHSQGGFLTYSLLMNTPELIAGAFSVSCGVIFQCEPSAYVDEALRKAQRKVPLAIVHGKNDPQVGFGMGDYANGLFKDANWPALHFFTDASAGHMFARLPVNQAIRWLEVMASDDPGRLIEFAETRLKANEERDAISAIQAARSLKVDAARKKRLDSLVADVNRRAGPKAKEFLKKIKENKDNSWVDAFLAFRDRFEFADAAQPVMAAFAELRAKHELIAKKALGESRTAFEQGKRDEGYAKLKEIVDLAYASSAYSNAKRQLAERK
jgi:predicted esterase